MVGDPRSRASYERRIRIASEAASWGIGAALLGTAALPTTDQASRIGLVASSLLLFLFATLWFHVFPDNWLGKSRFAVGAAITQVIAAILLVLTGGIDSRYFPYYVLPILATVFGMRISGTLFTGTIAVVAYLATLVAEVFFGGEPGQIDVGVIRLFALLSVIAMTALISRTIQETRFTLRQRTEELATQHAELSVARNTAVGLARVSDLHELVRVVYESAKNALAVDRLYLFASKPEFADGFTVGPDGAVEEFHADPTLPEDTPRRELSGLPAGPDLMADAGQALARGEVELPAVQLAGQHPVVDLAEAGQVGLEVRAAPLDDPVPEAYVLRVRPLLGVPALGVLQPLL